MAGLAEVIVELERQGFSGEEIIKAIDATNTADVATLTNAMICKVQIYIFITISLSVFTI